MGLKDEVMELIQQGSESALAELVARESRAVRPLVGRLWDPDETVRGRAARALGLAAGAHRDLGLDLGRRLMWALNDESGTNGVYALPALGEIGRERPEAVAAHVGALVSMAWDEGLRVEILRALSAVAESAPELVRPHLRHLARSVHRQRTGEREAYERLERAVGSDDQHAD